jgi:hypothetical protein
MQVAYRDDRIVARRSILRLGATLAGVAAVPLAILARGARAAGVEKGAVAYQDTPNSEKKCSLCVHFVPGNADTGSCKIVAGNISPLGWCRAWAAK